MTTVDAAARESEIRERWEPSPPGTPEWDAQRRFDIARAHAPYDVRFLLGETTRLHTAIAMYREALEAIQASPCYTGRPLGCESLPACPSCTASAALVNFT